MNSLTTPLPAARAGSYRSVLQQLYSSCIQNSTVSYPCLFSKAANEKQTLAQMDTVPDDLPALADSGVDNRGAIVS